MKKALFTGIGICTLFIASNSVFAAGARDYHIFQNQYEGLRLDRNQYRRNYTKQEETIKDDTYLYTVGYDFDYRDKCLERWGYSNHPECKRRYYYGSIPTPSVQNVYENRMPRSAQEPYSQTPRTPMSLNQIERVDDYYAPNVYRNQNPQPMENEYIPELEEQESFIPEEPVQPEPAQQRIIQPEEKNDLRASLLGNHVVASDPAPEYKDDQGIRIITDVARDQIVTFEVVNPSYIYENDKRLEWTFSRSRLSCDEITPMKLACRVKVDYLPGLVSAEFISIDSDSVQEATTAAIDREKFKINP